MPNQNLIAALEALLFSYGNPLNKKQISQLLNIVVDEIETLINALILELEKENRGLALIEHQETYQLITKPKFAELINQLIKNDFKNQLSPAVLETLSIIAYSGPVSKAEIEHIRGVNSNFTLRQLTLRDLINHENETYVVSQNFLKHLGLTSISQLPDYQKYRQKTDEQS